MINVYVFIDVEFKLNNEYESFSFCFEIGKLSWHPLLFWNLNRMSVHLKIKIRMLNWCFFLFYLKVIILKENKNLNNKTTRKIYYYLYIYIFYVLIVCKYF